MIRNDNIFFLGTGRDFPHLDKDRLLPCLLYVSVSLNSVADPKIFLLAPPPDSVPQSRKSELRVRIQVLSDYFCFFSEEV